MEEETLLMTDGVKIDRLLLSNIGIIDILNPQMLAQTEMLVVAQDRPQNYITQSGVSFTRLKIVGHELFDELIAGTMIKGNRKIQYCNLNLSIKDQTTHNLQGYSCSDYYDRLQQVADVLEYQYGVIVDFSDVIVKQIEVQRTVQLDNSFNDYYHVFDLLFSNLPHPMTKQSLIRDNTQGISYESFYAYSAVKKDKTNIPKQAKCREVLKVYDKSKQLKDEYRIIVSKNIMRVEIVLNGADKVKSALGGNRFVELTDEILTSYYLKEIEKLFVIPTEQWREQQSQQLLELMQSQREQDKRHWITNTLRMVQDQERATHKVVMLDITDLTRLINKLGIESKARRYKVKKAFETQAQAFEKSYCNNDNDKLCEVLGKITGVSPTRYWVAILGDTETDTEICVKTA